MIFPIDIIERRDTGERYAVVFAKDGQTPVMAKGPISEAEIAAVFAAGRFPSDDVLAARLDSDLGDGLYIDVTDRFDPDRDAHA